MKLKIEPWPPASKKGLTTGAMPIGVKVTDTDTGKSECVNIFRYFYMNKAEAIRRLEESGEEE